jgi:glycosyltransferase involved in cell wall biosynthesis
MKRLLIISANFPPTNAVDMHRIRVSLPYYERFGWSPTVLCFDPRCTDHPVDPVLLDSVPADSDVHRVVCISERRTRMFGVGAVGLRGLPAMRRAAIKLVKKLKPDLIFISTTSFPLMAIGPALSSYSLAPCVLDFQDPWVSHEGSIHSPTLKNRIIHWLHGQLERRTLPRVNGLISVSQSYLDVLETRYPETKAIPKRVVPFGVSAKDVEIARSIVHGAAIPAELESDLLNMRVGIYAGAYVKAMEPMVAHLFRSIAKLSSPIRDSIRLWFIGSNYSAQDLNTPLATLAKQHHVADVVREWPQRIPFYEALSLNLRADFNLLFGSTSKGYNPSKLFTLLSTGRPLLALTQSGTLASDLLNKSGGCRVIHVDKEPEESDLTCFFTSSKLHVLPLDQSFVDGYSAEATTAMQTALFDQVSASMGSRH